MTVVAAVLAGLAVWFAWSASPRPVSRPLVVDPEQGPGTAAEGRSGARWARNGWLTRRRRAAADARATMEACDLLAAELAAGRPPGAALDLAARQWSPLAPVAQAQALGTDVPDAMRRVATSRPGAADLRLVAAAWQVAQESGHGLARALDRVGRGIRSRRRTRRVVESELASARATARLVAVLPLAALVMGSGAGGDPWHFLLATPAGWLCLGAGSALLAGGLVWIETIADRAAPP